MLYLQPKPVVFDLDDFCEHYMLADSWKLLLELKLIYPKLKVTMFTIPLLCDENWLNMVAHKYPWIEMHYHGSSHEDPDEWLGKTEIEMPYPKFFYRGFKAPWWRMDQTTATALDQAGFIISACRGWFDIQASRVYRYNEGCQRVKGIWYENKGYHSVHSHVQHQKTHDGMPDTGVFETITNAFYKNYKFLFVSEITI